MEPSSHVLNIIALVGVSILNKKNSNREINSLDMAFGLHTILLIVISDLLIG